MLKTKNKSNPRKQFADLLAKYEQDADYILGGLKVEMSEKIYSAMEKRGVSQAELARRLGKSRAYISKILQGNVNFTLETLSKISQALDYELNFTFAANSRKTTRPKSTNKITHQKTVNLT